MYIPPEGIYFRLTARDTQHVVYSRRSPTPQVWHYKGPGVYDDQLFTLIRGTGLRAGLYAIKGKSSGYALYSRASPNPRVGHVVTDWISNEKYAALSCALIPLSLMLTIVSQLLVLFRRGNSYRREAFPHRVPCDGSCYFLTHVVRPEIWELHQGRGTFRSVLQYGF